MSELDGMEGGMARGSKTADLEARGFDLSHPTPFVRGVKVTCSQCEALVINGHASHERGCPNVVPVCRECGSLDPERTCCTFSEEDVEAAIAAEEDAIEAGQARWSETGSTRRVR